jgi:hypothetical protein
MAPALLPLSNCNGLPFAVRELHFWLSTIFTGYHLHSILLLSRPQLTNLGMIRPSFLFTLVVPAVLRGRIFESRCFFTGWAARRRYLIPCNAGACEVTHSWVVEIVDNLGTSLERMRVELIISINSGVPFSPDDPGSKLYFST